MSEQFEAQPSAVDSLDRFRAAQTYNFALALDEIHHSRKESHWMWYIFPQLAGLGESALSQHYAIKNFQEAQDFLRDPQLSDHLLQATEALLRQLESDAHAIFSSPDDLKLHSSLTLFYLAATDDSQRQVFQHALDKFFAGALDEQTLQLLQEP